MTANTATRSGPGVRAGHDSFAELLRAEWTKFRTVRGWVIGMVVAVLVTVLVGLLGPLGSTIFCNGPSGRACRHIPPLGPGGEPVTDAFYFAHKPLTGNGSITVRLASLTGLYQPNGIGQPGQAMKPGLQPWSKAGIIIKENTRQGSSYAAMMAAGGHGVRMQYDFTEDKPGLPGAVSAASPRWLRLTRSGPTITGYDSADAVHWTRVASATLPGLSPTVQAGMFAASPGYVVVTQHLGGSTGTGGPSLAIARFDHVRLHGTWSSGPWTGSDIGGRVPGEHSPLELGTGFQQAGGGFTVTGSGDIAPQAAGEGSLSKTIESSLVGVFAGLIAVIVVAAMFITAEYRRGLIRTTLAASPRRGRVLAAKAIVIGSAGFVAGLAAALAAVPLVRAVESAKGFYLFPVAPLTQLRAIAGTAALVAVAAVLALAVGTILRRSAGAVTAVIVAIVLPYTLATGSMLPAAPSEWLTRFTPAAAFAIQQTTPRYPQVDAIYTPSNGYYPLAPWAGFAVLCAWTAAALCLAAFLMRRRDA